MPQVAAAVEAAPAVLGALVPQTRVRSRALLLPPKGQAGHLSFGAGRVPCLNQWEELLLPL